MLSSISKHNKVHGIICENKCNMAWNSERKAVHTGTWTLQNMLAPLLASINAISCGVDTIRAPDCKNQKQHFSMRQSNSTAGDEVCQSTLKIMASTW